MNGHVGSAVTIVIAEPLAIVRAGLRVLLSGEPDFAVIGETGDGLSVARLVARLRPGILVLDPRLPGPSPDQLLADVLVSYPEVKVVVLAGPQELPIATPLLETGAAGCFLKSDRPEEFLRGVRTAAAGDLAVSGAVARSLLHRQAGHEPDLPVEALTEREREVLDLLTAGLSNKEIAQKLYLSVRTVEVHLRNVYAKLGVRSRLEAVTKTVRHEPPGSSSSRRHV